MSQVIPVKIIARLYCDFDDKFGIPRQSGIADEVIGKIVFEPEYRSKDALRGLDGYSHIWLLWQFSMAVRDDWSPTVRPPKLGGNVRKGVFATRSPFRPSNIGLSSVLLDRIDLNTPDGPVLYVKGADLMNGTPIVDIKPYLPFFDCHLDATSGFSQTVDKEGIEVDFPEDLLNRFPVDKHKGLMQVLGHDPRPGYQDDSERIYKLSFAGSDVHFVVSNGILTVVDVLKNNKESENG